MKSVLCNCGEPTFFCKNCQEGNVPYENVIYVSRDMAIDAGFLDMEGTIYSKEIQWFMCDCCKGDYQCCERCRKQSQLQNNL